MKSTLKQIGSTAARLLACAALLAASSALAATYTWTNSTGTSLTTSTSWTPNGTPSATAGDTMIWNGTAAGNLDLVMTADITGNPGVFASLTSGQTGYVTITNNAANRAIRFNQGNSLNIASGAGALTFGAGGGSPAFPFVVALGVGNGAIHSWTNNSASPVTIHTNVYFVMGGGGTHTLNTAGSGNFIFNNTIQPNNGAGLNLTVNGPGSVTVMGTYTPGVTWASGSAYAQTILNGGTLICGGNNSIGTNLFTINGGSLDSITANLTNMPITAQNWNGNFTFVGSQSLNLGAGPVTMNAARIVTVNANTLTVDGVIAGSTFSLTKAGAGTLLLNNANTYSGGTVVSNGVLKLGVSGAITNVGNVTVHGTLDVNGNSLTVNNLAGNNTGVVDTISGGTPTLIASNTSSTTFSGVIKNTSGTLALTKDGSGTLTLAGANTYGGGTAVNAGMLLVNGSLGAGAVTVAGGATLGGTNTIGGNVTWQSSSAASFILTPAVVTGSNSTPLTVSGTVTLNGNSLTVNVAGGTPLPPGEYTLMNYNNAGSSGAFAAGIPTYTGAGVQPGTASTVSTSAGKVKLTVALTGVAAVWTNNADGNWSVGANWSSNPTVPQAAGDGATLGVGSAYATITLNTPVSLGAVIFTNANSFLVANAGSTLTFDNSTIGAVVSVNAGTSNAIAPAVALNDNVVIASAAGTSLAITNTISNTSGAKTLTKSGAGTLVLSGNNTYGPASAGTVGTILTGGVLQLGNNSSAGTGDVSVSGSSTIQAGAAFTLANNIQAGSGATATVDNNGNNVTLSGVVSGAGALGKNGAGTLTLSSSNSYAGDTSISAGSVTLLNAGGIPGGAGRGNVNMGTNTALDLNGYSAVLGGLNSTFTSATVDNLAGGSVTLSLGGNGAFATFAGSLKNSSGTLALVKDGTSTQTLTGTNTYTGGTTINAGTLQVGNGGTTGSLGSGTVANSGNLQFNLAASNVFAGQITGTGAVTLANASLNLRLTGNNAAWTGPINFAPGAGGALWISSTAGLGVGPKDVQANQANATVHLDGSLGNLNVDSSINFNLSGTSGVLFNEAGSNTISGPVGLTFGNGNPYVKVNSGFLNFAGTVSAVNPRTLILGGTGDGLISGDYVDVGANVGSLTKQDAGTWTLAGTGNNYSGATTVSGGTLVIDGTINGNGAIAVNGGTMLLNGTDNGTGAATVATGAAFGGVGTMFSPVTWQAGSTGNFSVSASGETPLTIYNAVTLNNNNAITVNVTGATPLPVGIYTLLNEPNVIYSITGSFTNTPTITGAGLAAGTRAFVTTTTTAVKLTVVNSSVWTFNGNGNWTTGANWDSNPNYPNAVGQLAVLGVGSSLITVNLNVSQTIGGISFTNANSFVITNANNVLTLDNSGNGAQLGVTAGAANAIATGISLNDTTTANVASGTTLSVSGAVAGSAGLTVSGNGVLSLSGFNTYSGVTTLSGGTLALGSTNAIGSGSMTIVSGKLDSSVTNLLNANNNAQNWNGSFAFLGSQNLNLGNGSVTLGNNLAVTVNSNKLTVGGPISGGFTLTYGATNVVNNGILELDGANDFTGLTLVSGTVALGDDNAFGSAAQIQLSPGAVTPVATNLTIMSKDSTAHTIANGMSMNAFDGPYIFGGTGDLTLSGTLATGNGYKRLFVINKTIISGQVTDNGAPSGQVAKDGPGTLVLTADNTTTKPFRVDAGTLALGSTTAIGSGALTINGGGLDSTVASLVNANNNAQTWAGSFYFVGTENLNLGTGSVTMSTNTTITVSNNTLTVGGAVTGATRSLTKSGTGTLVLSGANTYSNTTVTAGTLEIAQATLNTNSTVAISNSAVLQLDFSTTNQVAALVLGGVSQAAGVYKAANSGGKITGTGSLLVVPTINANPPVMQVSVSGSTLTLAWPTNAGWILQSNSVGLASAAWFNYPANGAVDVTTVNITMDPAKTNVFFRMLKP